MKKAFTMIELIFVIVIIGILAAVAIPKLAASRSSAEAVTCAHEVGQLISDMSLAYIREGHDKYVASDIQSITNITNNITGGENGLNGIDEVGTTTLVSGTSINYKCDGVSVATITGTAAGTDFNLSVAVNAGSTPASSSASAEILKNIGGISPKVYPL